MKLRAILFAAGLAAVAGCVQTVTLQTPFDPAQHEYAMKPGKATVAGQAFMRRNDGIVVYAAGSPVYLLPDTAYTREIYSKGTNSYGPINLANADQRLVAYSRKGQADGEGRFSFAGVPDGGYLIVTGVTWMAGDSRQGGDLTQWVTVAGGQDVNAIISR